MLLCFVTPRNKETVSNVKQRAETIRCSRRSEARAVALLGAGLMQFFGRRAGFVLSRGVWHAGYRMLAAQIALVEVARFAVNLTDPNMTGIDSILIPNTEY